MQSIRRLVAASAALLVAPFVTAISLAGTADAATVHATAASSPGATVPFTEYLAATSPGVATNGTVLPVDYHLGTLQSEATGRQAVELVGQGQYVSFTLTSAANAVDFHYSIPDSLSGGGITQPLDLYVGNTLTKSLSLTSQYSWLYGSQATVTNTPTVGEADTMVPHDFFADVRYQFSSTLPVGTVVKLQVDAGDNSPWYAVNTADFYNVAAPITQPSNAINVTQAPYNADDTGSSDSTQALQNAINAASSSGQTVYLPQGTYTISQPLNVNNVTVEGAGEWYTTLTGSNVEFAGNGGNINISNLAIFGNVNTRVDSDGSVNGFNGTFSNSTINDVWIQNTKVGAWILGPTSGLTIENVQIQDTTADGVNFNAAAGAITNSTVENSFIRNTQDDGLAMWAENSGDTNDTFTQNTVNSPGVANNVALYGDTAGAQVTNNLLQDTVTRGGGIGIGQRFSSTAVSGTSTISGNELIRTGQYDPGWNYGVGAIWFWPQQGNMNATYNVTGNTILNSPYEAFQFQNENMYDGSATDTPPTAGYTVTGVTISGNTVTNVGTFVFQDQAPGSIEVDNTTATGVGVAGQFVCGSGFTINQGTGNSGWSGTTCGMPSSSPLWAYPGVTTFENATAGQATPTQRIAIMNTGTAAATLGAISASSGFTVSQDPSDPCGTSLASTVPGNTSVWCAVDVSFNAPSAGITKGTLTIPSNEPGSPTTVQLIGSTGANSVNNPPTVTPGALAFGYENIGSTSASQSVTVNNPGASAIAISSVAVSGPFAETNTCGSTLAAGASCTATVTFTPTAGGAASGRLSITNSATASPIGASLSGTGLSSTTNLALNATVSASSTASGFPASDVNDGNASTYWESLDGAAYPQTLTANLGQSMSLGSVTLDLPPASAWSTRTETLSVLGSTNGSSWTTLVPSANYTFNPSTGNTVSFNLPSGTNDQYLQLSFTGNTGWTAAQISEFEIFPGSTSGTGGSPSATLTASPSSLSFGNEATGSSSAAQTVTIQNTGSATASISGISAGTGFAETNTCGASLAAGATCSANVTFSPTAAQAYSANLTVSSNATNSTLTVGLSGTGTSTGTTTNLALSRPITASSSTQNYVAGNANDGNTNTYWESNNGAWPATISVDLGSSQTLGKTVIDLPPSSAWQTRTQTLSVLGSANDSTWTTIAASATYTWNPSTGNTVTITFPSGTAYRYVQLSFTANNVQNGAQVSEWQIFG
jgi:hypothetical protein